MAVHTHTVNTADTARAVSLYLGVPSTHPAIVAIASRISLDGLHVAPGADMSRDPAFHARIIAVGGRDLLDIVDPSRRAQLLEQQNQHGLGGARYASLLWGPYGIGHAWSDRGGSDGSSADYDTLSGSSTDWASPAGQSRMRDHAHRCGVGWMANNPELLRLGPAAIELFARTNFERQSYEQLRAAGFEPRDAVNIARYAEGRGLDANELARQTARAPGLFSGGNAHVEQEWRTHLRNHFANPDAPESRTWLRENLRNMRDRGTPEQREGATEMERRLQLDEQARNEANAASDAAAAERAAREAAAREAAARVAGARADVATADDAYGPAAATGQGNQQRAGEPATGQQQRAELPVPNQAATRTAQLTTPGPKLA